MNYEEKYKQALKVASQWHKDGIGDVKTVVECIFPELCESEDEMIRKDIIQSIQDNMCVIHKDKCIAWLEKQGEQNPNPCDGCVNRKGCINCENGELREIEQNPTDNVEPRFKVGDWIINKDKRIAVPTQILKIEKYGYLHSMGYTSFVKVKTDYHLWTIQDAKEGDVLVVGDEDGTGIAICGKNDELGNNILYCYYDDENGFAINTPIALVDLLHPSTKEQRDLLFQKMKEAGYEWDAEKKELKKIEKKPAWSEEDEKMCQETIDWFEKKCFPYALESENPARESIKWLKSLKDRVQPKQEWNEEDKRIRQCLIEDQEKALDEVRNDKYGHSEIISDLKEMYRERIDWLKSLRPQSNWKPSEEQMKHLKSISVGWHPSLDDCRILSSLYNDLLKL